MFIYYTFGIEIPDQVGDDENDQVGDDENDQVGDDENDQVGDDENVQVGDDEKGRRAASQYITMFQESARSDRGLLVRGNILSTFRP